MVPIRMQRNALLQSTMGQDMRAAGGVPGRVDQPSPERGCRSLTAILQLVPGMDRRRTARRVPAPKFAEIIPMEEVN